MGKQINYWMDYDNFLLVAQMAVDLGCTVVKEDLKIGKVIESKDAGIIPPYGTSNYPGYYFHLPEAGAIEVHRKWQGMFGLWLYCNRECPH